MGFKTFVFIMASERDGKSQRPGIRGSGMSETMEDRNERRRRRRARRRVVLDNSIPSPCIAVSQIDDASGLCLGCRRSIDEIREWPILSAEDKRRVLESIEERKSADRKAGV